MTQLIVSLIMIVVSIAVALVSGAVVMLMVTLVNRLTEQGHGLYTASVMVSGVGLVLCLIVNMLMRRSE